MTVVTLKRATKHLAAIAQYHDSQRLGLGDTFLDDFVTTVNAIRDTPTAFPIHVGKVRRAKCGRFPHRVFYELATRNRVRLLAIHHPSRDPAKWRDRG